MSCSSTAPSADLPRNIGGGALKVELYAPPARIPRIRPDDTATIPLFLCCDERFFPHSLAVIASCLAHASLDRFYDIFIVETNIPYEKLEVAARWMARYPNASLRFVDINPWLEKHGHELSLTREYSRAVYFRLFAAGIFTAYDRMAYLDSDIAVLADIAGFYTQDLAGLPLGAVEDPVSMHQALVNPDVAKFWREQLGKEPGEKYHFSGGLVMDLAKLREMDAEAAFLAKIRTLKNSRLPDQDVMNAVLNRKIKSIPLDWNCLDWMCDPDEEADNFLLLGDASRADVRAARAGVKVVHFAEKKPWTMAYVGKFAGHYWRYAAETPFYHDLRAAVLRDNRRMRLLSRKLITWLQQINFTLRLLFCLPEKRGKYRARIRNLVRKRQGMRRQSRFVRQNLEK